MNIGTIIKGSFLVGFVAIITGVYLKILHHENADIYLGVGIVANVVYIVTAIYEVQTSNRIDVRSKIFWTIGFILMSGLTGILYILFGRKKVASS